MVRHATLLILAGLIVAPLAVEAQPTTPVTPRATAALAVDPAMSAATTRTEQRLAAPLSFDPLSYEAGLPNSHVGAIIQDPRGFIWFGTQDGLARYDGTRMRVYRVDDADKASLSAGYITSLTLDASGKLWVGTQNGINLYDPDTDKFTRYMMGPASGLGSAGATASLRDKKDRLWFAMTGGGISRFVPETGTFKSYQAEPLDAVITALAVDATGNLWLGTAADGLIRWNPDDGSTATFPMTDTNGLGGAAITEVLVASDGKIWLGSDGGGLAMFEPAGQQLTSYRHDPTDPTSITDDHVSVLFEDRAKHLWIGTTNGLNRMDATGDVARYYNDPNDSTSLAFPGIEALYQDAGGVMWVGGFTVGVCKFDEFRTRFGRYRTLSHPTNSFFEDDDGSVWVGTYHGGLYHYDWAKQRVAHYKQLAPTGGVAPIELSSAWIAAIHRDKRGTLWLALQGQGLVAFDTKAEQVKQYLPNPDDPTNSLPVDTLWDILEDAQGKLWLASWGGGLVQFDPQAEIFKAFTTDSGIGMSSNHIYKLYSDPIDKGILWLGTAEGGLVRFDPAAGKATSRRAKADDPASLSSDDILSMHRDQGVMWLGTYGGGLNRLDLATGKVTRYTRRNSKLTNDVIFGILPDDTGHLWLSTNGGGLVQFDPATKVFLTYTASDGVQGNEFGQGSFLRSRTGKLYFGGVNGFNAFLPKDITRDAYVPPVAMTAFKVANQDVPLARPIWTLPGVTVSYADSFEIQFAALSFAAPAQNRYAYKLEGFDEKFVETDRPFATFTKLDGGKYTLRVRAANRHGVWNETGVALRVNVKPPLWRTWPAYIAYLLLLTGAVFAFYAWQQTRLRRVERDGRLAVVERDLALTGAVQSGFLPEYSEVRAERLQLYGFYRGADACSGDWWWHETLPGRHVVLVGDVTGHGPGPAMVTAAVATAFRVVTDSGIADVREALEILHRTVQQVAKGKYTMTMAALELNEFTGEWVLLSAGAPPVMSIGSSGKHRIHFAAGTPLGTDATFELGRVEGQLAPFERILIYTDGIPELMLPSGQALGMRRLGQMFERTAGQDIKVSATAIVQQADLARGVSVQDDDWTFTIVEWRGAPQAAEQ